MMKRCTKHGQVSHFMRPDGTYRCGKCASLWVTTNRVAKKRRLVELFGGQCRLCGYRTYVGALDFHHVDPSQKKFALSVRGLCYSWRTVLAEAKKCVLLCKNCHSEVENGIVQLR
jgi:hypothetical protein